MSEIVPLPGAGWLDFLKGFAKLPGAVKAINRLVTSGADAGAAWLDVVKAKGEQVGQDITDETAARTKTVNALVKAAGQQAGADQALVDRAIQSWVGDRLRCQTNRERVAAVAVDSLQTTPPENPETCPSDDWLNQFAPYAERASSDEMQQLWGRILAGEVRTPGAFSLRTLSFVSTLERETTEQVVILTGMLIAGAYCPNMGQFGSGTWLYFSQQLEDAGILSASLAAMPTLDAEGRLGLAIGPGDAFHFSGTPGQKVALHVKPVSKVGLEILQIVSPRHQPDLARHIADELAKDTMLKLSGNSSTLGKELL